MSVWVAFVAQAVRERRGCLSGWHAMELQKRSFRRPSSLRTSWKSVWVACNGTVPSPKQSENVVDVCLGCIFRRWRSAASVAQAVRKTSWVSVWVAFVAQAVRERRGCLSGWPAMELQKRSFRRPSSLRSSWSLSGLHSRRWRSAASVAQAVRKRRGCLSGWHSLLKSVVGVCLGGMQWSCRRGASVDQAV